MATKQNVPDDGRQITLHKALCILIVGVVAFAVLIGVLFLFGGRLTHSAIRSFPRDVGVLHRRLALQQGNVPEIITDPVALGRIRSRPSETFEFDVWVDHPFYFVDESHPQAVFSDIPLKKGDYLEIIVSGQPIQWTRDEPNYIYPRVGPDGGDRMTTIRMKSLIPKYALPNAAQACVVGQIGTGLKSDNKGVPWIVGKRPDPWFVGTGPIVVRVPENGATLYLALNLLWMQGSWTNVSHVSWHVTVKKYS